LAITPSSPVTSLPLGLRQALERGDCVLFLGAGIGGHYRRPGGTAAPDGAKLVEDLISYFKLGIDPKTDLARTAQLVEIRHKRPALDNFIKKALADLEPDDNIKWLTTFRWRAIYTTNYDMGLESAYRLNGNPPQNPIPISVTSDLIYTDTHVDVPIFHLHGTPYNPSPSPMVLTQADYTRYQDHRAMVWNRLKNDGLTSTILYIGYSGRDNNWQQIVEEMAREFSPSKPPMAYRLDPFADAIDVELHREVRRVETLMITLPEFRALVDKDIGDYRPGADTFDKYKKKVPHHLLEHYETSPAAMLRLLESWQYVNGESTTDEPNTKGFLLGSKPTWSLIAQDRRFIRDIEDPLWEWTVEFITNPKAKSTAALVTGPAGYGITTILMGLALKIVNARNGPVFILREGAEVNEGDVAYAATLFPEVPCYFVIDQAREHVGRIHTALAQQRKTASNCLFLLGERRNEWLTAQAKFHSEDFDVVPLSDGEINRLLDYLSAEGALGDLEELDRSFQFNIVKNKHEKELLVAMREATDGKGAGFDAIIENEYRGIDDGKSASLARELYLLVCCFHQHGVLIRDRLLEDVLGVPLKDLHKAVGSSLEGLVEYAETDRVRGEYAARARHRIIAEIVWKKCGSHERKENLLQKAMEKLNHTYRLDKTVFEMFIRSDEIVDTFRTLDGKIKFFETAARRDPDNVFVLQHFARMLRREQRLNLALTQIDLAIAKDRTNSIRSLHHTRGLILADLATTEDNADVARKWMAQSEREFLYCMAAKETDSYGHSGLANLYFEWSRRPRIPDDEAAEYLEKAEGVISDGLKVVSERASLLIISAEINREIGNQPARLSKLRQAVDSDSASVIGRYLLARAYREQKQPKKTIEVLEPVIKTDFKAVRSYIEYTRAMLEIGESFRKGAAVLSQCRLDGETDPAFIGLYGGLLHMDKRYDEAAKLWQRAKEQNFTYDERIKRQFEPRDPADQTKRLQFSGVILNTKPGYVVIQPDDGPTLISTTTMVGKTTLQNRRRVTFVLSFSAKGPLAEGVQLA
jgi:tetratricopeptide (TPR) repeat protein/cold shock CspA family protein